MNWRPTGAEKISPNTKEESIHLNGFGRKFLHVARQDEAVKKAAYTWMEHCDLMTYLLIDNKDLKSFKRSRCAAGHKAMWHEDWNGLPPEEFLEKLDPYLASLRGRLYDETYTSDLVAGNLNQEWATQIRAFNRYSNSSRNIRCTFRSCGSQN